MSQEIQQLQNEAIILKSRIFDLSEAVQARDQELNAHRGILAEVCRLLNIDGTNGVQGEVVVAALKALVEAFPTTTDVCGDDPEPADAEEYGKEPKYADHSVAA